MKSNFTLYYGILTLLFAGNCNAGTLDLILDLNADKGVTVEDGSFVSLWQNQVADYLGKDFVKRDQGRKTPGSGRPQLIKSVQSLNGHNALDFHRDELVCMDPTAFASLTTSGDGFTWFVVLAPHVQTIQLLVGGTPRPGTPDAHAFFGNLRNGGNYEGVFANFTDDGTLWWGVRNDEKYGRFDSSYPRRFSAKVEGCPHVIGPKLEPEKFVVLAGRLPAGKGTVKIDLFVNGGAPISSKEFELKADTCHPNQLAIGQERDAIGHPGNESFDGEIARILIFKKSLDDRQIQAETASLMAAYGIK